MQERYQFRSDLVGALERDLLGPESEFESIDESPLDRYVTGVLHPAALADPEEPDDPPTGTDGGAADGGYDPGVALALMRRPSSMGLSFAVDLSAADSVRIDVTAARYKPSGPQDVDPSSTKPADMETQTVRSRAFRPRGDQAWMRLPVDPDTITLPVTAVGPRTFEVESGLDLFCVVREAVGGVAAVTVVLRNRQQAPRGALRDPYCWFQPRIVVRTSPAAIVDRKTRRTVVVDDDDLRSYDLLFRDVRNFAAGHGCSVSWAPEPADRTSMLETTFVPAYDLRLATPRAASPATDLRMSFLADAPRGVVVASLRSLVRDYTSWIQDRRAHIAELPHDLQDTAARHMDDAVRASERIEDGIKLIEGDDQALEAFRLTNKAMREQRARQDWIRGGRLGAVPDGAAQAWRPFQIAFVLLNLRGISEPGHADREVADLLWFPTGGGKTEAYLGLISYTIILRRLRSPAHHGVSVLMRYTLRLLTIQQFERAATLICALEKLRAEHPVLRNAADISLGLWVGQGATPNSLDDAQRALRRLRTGQEPEKGNPIQLTRCPWCGVALDVENYAVRKREGTLVISCGASDCWFRAGIPVHVVDETVYRARPSLLIGTVDKFAMMAWREDVRSLFASDGRGTPPDLIVQDELHLISGPLGTMVGLYEAAVDRACSSPYRPKVIASTATIRRAKAQMRAVFDRDSAQFPPPGLDMADSFFAVEAGADEKGTRQYVGVMAPGTSPTTMLVRTYASLAQEARELPAADEVRDPYWTLVGYFNSLRVLGGAYMQVIDDVPDRLGVLASRRGSDKRELMPPLELTSRTESSKIAQYLAQLGESYPSEDSPDVVLATNMISVGVDVDRLGLMAVMGQPQSTAEYIQASSRVGRQHPGLVVVMFNAARSRDRSHYENFLPYHQALYRQVEATSATPFAARARDRGLHGVLVSLARLLVSRAAADGSAADVGDFADDLRDVVEIVGDRAGRTDPNEQDGVAGQLDELIDIWVREAAARGRIRYSSLNNPHESLLVEAGRALTDPDLDPDTRDLPWPTLMSLRDVDAESHLYLLPNRDGNLS